MFNFLPRDTAFFDLFDKIADHIVASAQHLCRLVKEFPSIDGVIQLIRREEHEVDSLAHTALNRLDRAFITPFDREDIHTLVSEMDDVVDTIDALVKRLPLFHVTTIEPEFLRQTDVLLAAAGVVQDTVRQLRKSHKLSDLSQNLIEIHHQESIGDDNHHAAMSRLFSGQMEALEVMKWKVLLDYIEQAIDGCEDVGNTVERMVLKAG
jgi:uncharacterized protein